MRKRMLDPVMDVYKRELIGGEVVVKHHTDPTMVGVRGIIIDETRNTFVIRSEDSERRVPKKGARFHYHVRSDAGSQWVLLDGEELIHRPEDRTKKMEKKRIGKEDLVNEETVPQ
ncbi:MAG: ribonuclease P protein component 1 [Thermoplasmatota archaeon]